MRTTPKTSVRAKLARVGAGSVAAALLAACAAGSGTDAEPSSDTSGPTTSAVSDDATSPTSSGTDGTTGDPVEGVTRLSVTVVDGKVSPPLRRVKLSVGDTVRMRVTADVADEVHVHGVDKSVGLEPGTPTVVRFTVTEPGVFEVELEDAGLALVQLEVR